ncbi:MULTISPECIES: VWA domain-containing protein [Thermomonosporaceae]|uniref:VWA domain-containing protein n=1 Tax=Thermomonosporaceae TaxID=2012 RepID=UPI00255AA03C|nr:MULTISPECIES: VWA domain-containing protein [Thermomonosporaceae]MDL4775777.1 VWA domain-containing protein [Actinomadura xylanilytica]
MITRRWLAGGCLLGVSAALTLFGTPAVSADDGGAAEPPKVELVLDVSGSMRARDIDGRSRMSVAQQSMGEVVDALPAETQLGFRVLGSRYRFPGSSKAVGCKDTQQIAPVGPMDKVETKAAIATLRPTGWTPIGLALRAAAKDLGTGETTRRIVLITDGEDTCSPPDPCDVARELAAQGTHLVVDTLGLTLDDKVRRQLTCIADATGGTYTAVQHQQELTGRLNQLVQRARTTYKQTPHKVAGGAQCANAPVLAPGVYTDRERFGEHRWYRVSVAPGQELRTSVSVALDRKLNPDYGVLLRAVSQGGQELVRGTGAGSGRTDVQSTGLRWSDQRPETDVSASPTPGGGSGEGTVCLVVSNSFSAPASVRTAPGMPLELTVDLVRSSDAPGGPDLGRGWLLLAVLAGTGLVAGLITGWLARWRVAIWKEN